MGRTPAPLVLLAAALACARATPPAPGPVPAAAPAPPLARLAPLDTAALRRDLTAFAHDSMLGREAGTIHAVAAARFIAAELARAGVEPAGDSGYFQRVPMRRQALAPKAPITVTERNRARTIPVGAEGLVPIASLGAGIPLPRLYAQGDLVFAGYALTGELGRDDLADLDLTGKVAVYVRGAPASADSATRARLSDPTAIGERLMRLVARNPAAVIVLATGREGEEFARGAGELMESVAIADSGVVAPRLLPMVMIGVAREGSPLLPAGWPDDDRAQPLRGRRFSARFDQAEVYGAGYNVVGLVRGRDEARRGRFVAFGAHLDHIGVQPSVRGDSIANGADDDGSGSTALLAIARAWAGGETRPARSALFVWHTGEEKGLLGSEWFTRHPTVPLDSIDAMLNADMIGRNAPDSLYLVGPQASGSDRSRALGALVDSVNASLPRPFRVNREWDSRDHPEQIYFRSDHFNYAREGIPIVFFTTGLHEDYHRPSDEVSRIDFAKLARVAELMMRAGVAAAER